MGKLENIVNAVVAGDDDKTKETVGQVLAEGVGPMDIINDGLVAGLDIVGRQFQSGETFLPEMMLAAIAAQAGIAVATKGLKPGEYKAKAVMVLGTVKGDVHDIGKNLVSLILRSRAFEVVDLGVDIDEEEFVHAVRKHQPQFLGMSALMTTTMANMEDVIDALVKAEVRDNLKVVVGGAAVNQDFASRIGADGYALDVGAAAVLMEKLLTEIRG